MESRCGLGAVLLIVAMSLGCAKESTRPVADTSDASTSDAAAGDGECLLQSETCGPSSLCCTPSTGFRADLDRECLDRAVTAFACRGTHAPGATCPSSDGEGCIVRTGSGEREAFYTQSSWSPGEVPGFEPCSEELQERVFSLIGRECGP